ncbi:hypothetical protein EV12_2127 [Prochlorococcus sp. MIT 0701]|nr:hypothetical protein EV12_2127 [Prochlorococcus sp. MIT 0701]
MIISRIRYRLKRHRLKQPSALAPVKQQAKAICQPTTIGLELR